MDDDISPLLYGVGLGILAQSVALMAAPAPLFVGVFIGALFMIVGWFLR